MPTTRGIRGDSDDGTDTDQDDSSTEPSRSTSPSPTSPEPRPTAEASSDSEGNDENDERRSTDTTPHDRSRGPERGRSTGSPGPADNPSTDDTRCADPPAGQRSTSRADAPSGNAEAPSDLFDLGNWYLTLPTGPEGDPDTVQPAELTGYSSEYFQLNESRDGVVFTAPVAGATTRNSDYPRSELREMDGTEEAAWSNEGGTHTLRATEAVTELPESKPELVTAQIHGGDDDILQIRLEGTHLMAQYADGAEQVTLDPDYRLGTPYDIEIVATEGSVRVGYNGELKADLPLAGSTWYFKAGAYVQSNPDRGDAPTAAGQVIIYSLEVAHT